MTFAGYGVSVKHIEITADGSSGLWRIGPAIIPTPAEPAIKAIVAEIEIELSLLYELDGKN